MKYIRLACIILIQSTVAMSASNAESRATVRKLSLPQVVYSCYGEASGAVPDSADGQVVAAIDPFFTAVYGETTYSVHTTVPGKAARLNFLLDLRFTIANQTREPGVVRICAAGFAKTNVPLKAEYPEATVASGSRCQISLNTREPYAGIRVGESKPTNSAYNECNFSVRLRQ